MPLFLLLYAIFIIISFPHIWIDFRIGVSKVSIISLLHFVYLFPISSSSVHISLNFVPPSYMCSAPGSSPTNSNFRQYFWYVMFSHSFNIHTVVVLVQTLNEVRNWFITVLKLA